MSETRKAKYCPNCGTMAQVDATVCTTCGHHYHTGITPPESIIRPEDDDEFNKTQLFMMSPVLMQRPPTPVTPLPVGNDASTTQRPDIKKIAVIVSLACVLLAGIVWAGTVLTRPPDAHPRAILGRWARATDRGTVGLLFAADGSGALFWQPAPGAGQGEGGNVLLHWTQTAQRRIKLTAAQDVSGSAEVQQSVQLLSSQPWPWDSDGKKLILGRLNFMRQ